MNSGFRARLFWPLILAAGFFTIPTLLAHAYPTSLWTVTDYETLGLADALNMAYRLADLQMYRAVGLTNHPGVPFYFLSWLALALTGYPVASGKGNFFQTVVEHAETYHQIILVLGALVGAAGVYVFAAAARKRVPVAVTLAALLVWLVSSPASLEMFMSVSIDSFAIIANALFFAVLVPLAYDNDIDPDILVVAGFVGAFAYLNKLPYIYVPLALYAALLLKMIFLKIPWRRGLRLSAVYLGSLTLVLAGAIMLVIGREGAHELYLFQKGVFLGSGLYGGGSRTVVSTSEVWQAILAIPRDRAYAVPIAFFGGAALALAGLITAVKRPACLGVAILNVGAGSAAALSALIVIKHYDLHYTAGVSATLPACLVSAYLLIEAWGAKSVRLAAAAVVALAVLVMARQVETALIGSLTARTERSKLTGADLDKIHSLWAGHDRAIEFAYRAPFAEAAEGFLVVYGSVPRMTYDYLRSQPRTIASMAAQMVSRDVGAYVIDKAYFPTVESVKTAPNVALLGPTPVKFAKGDRLIELQTVFFLIRG